MVVRDEWPLVAVSVSHALRHHVDAMWVFDHASSDDTLGGLHSLQDLWGDRLTVRALNDVPYLMASVVAGLADVLKDDFEWLYVIDADEFAMSSTGESVRDVVASLDVSVDALRYSIENWIAPRDFDLRDPDQLVKIQGRAVTSVNVDIDGVEIASQIRNGGLNYFDVPFRSKVLMRLGRPGWLEFGTHGIEGNDHLVERTVTPDRLRVAHLPLLSRNRLRSRVRAGQELIDHGFSVGQGWQWQMICRLEQDGQLDDFWRRHSIGDASEPEPRFVIDESFRCALEPVIDMLSQFGFARDEPSAPSQLSDPLLTGLFRTLQSAQQDILEFQHEMSVVREREHELNNSVESLIDQRDEASRQRDELYKDREAMLRSRTWRIGLLINQIVRRANKVRRRAFR